MKVRVPARQPVQSLGRQRYQGSAPSTGEAITSALGNVIQTAAIAQGQKTKRQKQQAALYSQKREAAINEANAGKNFYDVDELPSEFITEGMRVKGRVMSSEVFPQMYDKEMSNAIKDASLIIEDTGARSDWLKEATLVKDARSSSIQAKANKLISAQIIEDQKFNYKNAMDSGQPDVALSIAEGMDIPKAEKEVLKLDAEKRKETDMYSTFMAESDIEGINQAIANLSDTEGYEPGGGKLNPKERVLWQHHLRVEKTRIEGANDSAIKAAKKMITKEVEVTISNLLKGYSSDPNSLMDLANRANKIGTSPALIEDMNSAFIFATANDFQNKMPRAQRLANMDAIVEQSGLPNFRKTQLKDRLMTSHINQSRAEESDLMQSAVDAGFIDLTPLNSTDPGVFAAQLKARHDQMNMVQDRYGIYNNKMLPKSEAEAISSILNNMPAKDKVPYLAAIAQGLGEDATDFYEQLTLDGSSTSMAIAGITSIKGTASQAEAIIMGNEYRRQNKDEIHDVKQMMSLQLSKNIGTAFYNAPGMQRAVKDATLDAYIYYSLQSGAPLTDFDSDIYDMAMIASTGGMVSYGSQQVQAPVYGMKSDGLSEWARHIDPSYIDKLGGVDGMKSSTFTENFRKENFKLIGAGHGKYYVTRMDGTHLKNETTGGAFIIKYDPDAATRDISTRLSRRKRR